MESNASAPAPEIVPFWNRLREIALYPAHPAALTTIGVLALCHLVTDLPLGFVLDLLVWIALYRYAFECLRATADGRMEPPEIAVSVGDSLGWSQILLQCAFFLFNMGGFIFLGKIGGGIVSIVLALALPGAIMALAMDEDLARALNPATWLAIGGRLGWPYLAVAALYFLFNVSQHFAQSLIVPILPPVLAEIAFYFMTQYVIVATFHLMGYLIYQYHDEVGYEPVPPQPLSRTTADPDQLLLDEAAELVRDGKPEAAADVLGHAIRGRGGSDTMHAQYRKLLALLGRRDEQLRHGREWLTTLLVQNKDTINKQWNTGDNGSYSDGTVFRIGGTQVAMKLVAAYIKTHPKHRDVPRNALLAAKVLAERMGQDDVAKKLLDQVSERFPDDALAPEIAAYRASLDRLGAPQRPG